jgi:chromosome segregation ATPase
LAHEKNVDVFDSDYERRTGYTEIGAQDYSSARQERMKLQNLNEVTKLKQKSQKQKSKSADYQKKYEKYMAIVAKYQQKKATYKSQENKYKSKSEAIDKEIAKLSQNLNNLPLKKREKRRTNIAKLRTKKAGVDSKIQHYRMRAAGEIKKMSQYKAKAAAYFEKSKYYDGEAKTLMKRAEAMEQNLL